MTTKKTTLLFRLATSAPCRPTPSELAELLDDIERGTEVNGNQALEWLASGRSVWPMLYRLCLAAGHAETAPWPGTAMDAWSRIRGILEVRATLALDGKEDLLIDGERAGDDDLVRLFSPNDAIDMEPCALAIVHSAVGLIAYAMRRAELSGVPCLAIDEDLSVVLRVVLGYHARYQESGRRVSPSMGLAIAIGQAQGRADTDHQAGHPDPFAELEAWEAEGGSDE